jgi:hypothetical protein
MFVVSLIYSSAFGHSGNLLNAAVFRYGLVGLPTEGMADSTVAVVLLAVAFVLFPKAAPPTETLKASVQSVPSLALDLFAEEATADAASQIFAAPLVFPLVLLAVPLPLLALHGSAAHCCCHILCSDSDHSGGSPEWFLAAGFPQLSIRKRSVPHCRGVMDERMGTAPRGNDLPQQVRWRVPAHSGFCGWDSSTRNWECLGGYLPAHWRPFWPIPICAES